MSDYSDDLYNDDSVLLDGLYEFHPEFFADLDSSDWQALQRYFLVGRPVPDDVFAYRHSLLSDDGGIEAKALRALMRVCHLAGIEISR
jgi:hypothetical protein